MFGDEAWKQRARTTDMFIKNALPQLMLACLKEANMFTERYKKVFLWTASAGDLSLYGSGK